jgi:prepilin-type N-terminal cleavage/methylation domain-containing protein
MKRSKGFTLLELMISMAVLSLAIAAVFYIYVETTKIFTDELTDSDMNFQTGKAMDRMSRELQQALKITSKSSTGITFWYQDTNNNGTREAGETVTYSWVGGTTEAIYRTVVSTTERIANNINKLDLSYDNAASPEMVTISITGRINSTVSTIESSVKFRNL